MKSRCDRNSNHDVHINMFNQSQESWAALWLVERFGIFIAKAFQPTAVRLCANKKLSVFIFGECLQFVAAYLSIALDFEYLHWNAGISPWMGIYYIKISNFWICHMMIHNCDGVKNIFLLKSLLTKKLFVYIRFFLIFKWTNPALQKQILFSSPSLRLVTKPIN